MRRLFSLTALLTLWWSQGVALRCHLGAAASHGLGAAHGSVASPADFAARPAGPLASPREQAEKGALPLPHGEDCRIVMTCAWAMIDAAEADLVFELAAPLHRYAAPIRAPHATADVLADPPPPRLDA